MVMVIAVEGFHLCMLGAVEVAELAQQPGEIFGVRFGVHGLATRRRR
jgi:hypothetical protein